MSSSFFAVNYTGPIELNNFLHSFPHCTFKDGCHSIPFTDAPDEMVEFHSNQVGFKWMESLMMIGFVPLAGILLYLLIDILVQMFRYCCCKSATGPCWCCCRSSNGSPAADNEESFLQPSPSSFGSRTYGAFPTASIEPATLGITHNPKRGGVAGQSSDMFHGDAAAKARDDDNPFHTSSRLVAVAQVDHSEVIDEGAVIERKDPDRNYERRTIAAIICCVIALTLLAVSIAFSQKFSTSWNEIRSHVEETHFFVQVSLRENGADTTQIDCQNVQQALNNLLAAGMASSQPFDQQFVTELTSLVSRYGSVSTNYIQPFADVLHDQTHHLADARSAMNEIESVRIASTYSVIGAAMFFTIVTLIVHVYYRQRLGLSVLSKTIFGIIIGCSCWIWAIGLIASVGVSDVCQDPVIYANSALNSSYVREDRHVEPIIIETAQYYVNCRHTGDGADNPITPNYYLPLVNALASQPLQGELNKVVQYIETNRGDLIQYSNLLTQLNASTWQHVDALGGNLGCEFIHSNFIAGAQTGCHSGVVNIFTATTLQFFACFFLLFIRCLLWMRRRRTSELIDDEDEPPFESSKGATRRIGITTTHHAHFGHTETVFGNGSTNFGTPRPYAAI